MKFKKSLLALAVLALGTVTLGACNGGTENNSSTSSSSSSSSSNTATQTEVTWAGLTALELVWGDIPADYDWTAGVTATTADGTQLTVGYDEDTAAEIAAATNTRLFPLEYTATDASGNVVATQDRVVRLINGYKLNNGDLSQGSTSWSTKYNPSSTGSVEVADGELHYTMTDAGTEAWQLQTEYDGAQLKAGETYKFTVEARAAEGSEGKSIALGFEDLDNGYAVMLPAYVEYSLTTEMTEYSVYYTADKDYNNVKVALYLGRGLDADDKATAETPLEFYVDNMRIERITDQVAEVEFTNTSATSADRFTISGPEDIQGFMDKVTATYNGQDVTEDIEWVGELPEAFDSTIATTNIGMMATYTAEDGKIAFAYVGFNWQNPTLDRDYDYEPFNASFDSGFTSWNQDFGSYPESEGTVEYTDNEDGTISIHLTPKMSAADWHVQLWQSSSKLVAGHSYRIALTGYVQAEDPSAVLIRTEFDGDKHKTDIHFTGEMSTIYSDIYTPESDRTVRTGILLAENTAEYTLVLDSFTVIDVTENDPAAQA